MKNTRLFKFLFSNRWYFVIWMMLVGAIVYPVVSVFLFHDAFDPKEITRSLIPSFLSGLLIFEVYRKKKIKENSEFN